MFFCSSSSYKNRSDAVKKNKITDYTLQIKSIATKVFLSFQKHVEFCKPDIFSHILSWKLNVGFRH